MAKKSNAKTAKLQSSLAEKTEQILLTMPKIIATQIGKDLAIQQQQVTKLNLEVKKVELQKKKLTQKLVELKKKTTAAAKKQAKTTQKALQKTTQALSALIRSLEAVKKQFQLLSQKKAKYLALQAQLISFQKDWVKKMSNQAKAKPKAKVKAKAKPAAKKLATPAKAFTSATHFPQQSSILGMIEVPPTTVEKEEEFEEAQMERVS